MSDTSDEELSQDTLFSLLSNPRRRFILQYLNRNEEPITLQDLATEIAAWENETEPENLTDKQQKRLYVSLYQTHVPKLEEAGIIDYDSDSGEIRLRNQATDLNVYLEGDVAEPTETRPWQLYYLALALAGAVAYGLISLGIVPVGEVGALVFGFGWMLLLAGLATFHYLETRDEEST